MLLCSHCREKPIVARSLCKLCYNRLRRRGTLERKNVQNIGSCSVDGCDKPAWAKGMCPHHYEKSQHPLAHSWRLLRSRYPGQFPPSWNRFDAFLADVGERPESDCQLRRIHEDRPYSADNVRWVTPTRKKVQAYTPEQQKSYCKEGHLQRKFGLTGEHYDALLKAQGGGCAVCHGQETHISKNGSVKELAVDHDHATGAVRGLLCFNCNQAIGRMQDNPERLEAAAAYLRRTKLTCEEVIG